MDVLVKGCCVGSGPDQMSITYINGLTENTSNIFRPLRLSLLRAIFFQIGDKTKGENGNWTQSYIQEGATLAPPKPSITLEEKNAFVICPYGWKYKRRYVNALRNLKFLIIFWSEHLYIYVFCLRSNLYVYQTCSISCE